MDKEKKSLEEIIQHAEETSDLWEPEGPLGNDPRHMKLKNRSGIRSIRIDDKFLEKIKTAAKEEGFDSYQSYIKVILKKHLNDRGKKKKAE